MKVIKNVAYIDNLIVPSHFLNQKSFDSTMTKETLLNMLYKAQEKLFQEIEEELIMASVSF